MGRVVLQMMSSLDGMVSGKDGDLGWIASDDALNRDHLARVQAAELLILGAGVVPGMVEYWAAAQDDPKLDPVMRDMGRAMTAVRKVVYTHANRELRLPTTDVHVVADEAAFAEDVRRLARDTQGMIVSYGGVRLARSLVKHGLVDELHLDVCPIVLGAGQRLFDGDSGRRELRLRQSTTYASGTTMLHYDVNPAR